MSNFEIFDNIELEICDCLNAIVEEAEKKKYIGDGIWTNSIKEKLSELGDKHGFNVSPDESDGEWLFDLIWYVNDSKTEQLIRLPLVMESEWNRSLGHIRCDFEKLLVANAERRLMICQAKHELIEERFRYFECAIRDYQHNRKGDRYLIAILDDYYSGEFVYKLIIK